MVNDDKYSLSMTTRSAGVNALFGFLARGGGTVVCAELEPTDDEIEAELNTMLGAPAAAAALADVKQEA